VASMAYYGVSCTVFIQNTVLLVPLNGYDNLSAIGQERERERESKEVMTNKQTNKQTMWPLLREQIIPTERPPLVDEI
jgi:hypothetical protein